MISYKKLWIRLLEQGMTKQQLVKEAGFSLSTLTKLNRNEYVSMTVLVSICHVLKCDIGDIMEVISENEE